MGARLNHQNAGADSHQSLNPRPHFLLLGLIFYQAARKFVQLLFHSKILTVYT